MKLETSFLKSILTYSEVSAVCSLEFQNKVFLFSTKNLSLYLAKLCSDLVSRKHSCSELIRNRKKLKLNILETDIATGGDPCNLKLQEYYWYKYYSRNGYEILSKPSLHLIPYVKVTVKGVFVELRNKGYKSFVIGKFDNIHKANEWVSLVRSKLDEGIVIYHV